MSLSNYIMSLLLQGGANVQEAFEETVESEIDSSVVEDEDLMLKEEKSNLFIIINVEFISSYTLAPPTDSIPEPTAMIERLQQLSTVNNINS